MYKKRLVLILGGHAKNAQLCISYSHHHQQIFNPSAIPPSSSFHPLTRAYKQYIRQQHSSIPELGYKKIFLGGPLALPR